MVGFLCSTPYHILLSINMALNDFKDDKKSIVIFRRFLDSDRICNILKDSGIFEEVILLETHNFDGLNNWNRRLRMIFFYNKFNKFYTKYDFSKFIFFSLDFLDISFIVKKLSMRSPQCEFAFAEDGIGSYVSSQIYMPSEKAQNWLRLLKRQQYLDMIQTIYLQHPDLLAVKLPYKIKKINSLNIDNEIFYNITKLIWKSEEKSSFDMLFLYQPFLEDGRTLIGKNQEKLLNDLSVDFLQELTVKLHPRASAYRNLNGVNCLKSDSLFEIDILHNYSIRALIGINSTALLTPFLLWGQVIPIIFLYKICGVDKLSSNMDEFIIRFKEKFEKSGGKIFIPESYKDLKIILSSLEK